MKHRYGKVGPVAFGIECDVGDEYDDYQGIEQAYIRVSKFQIVYEWRAGWKELSFAWG